MVLHAQYDKHDQISNRTLLSTAKELNIVRTYVIYRLQIDHQLNNINLPDIGYITKLANIDIRICSSN